MSSSAPFARSESPNEPPFKRLTRATGIDARMVGMIAALALLWLGFHVDTYIQTGEGQFLTPRNLRNLLVETSSIAVMATGMALIIVMRQIDLSVGAIVAFVSTVVGVAQVYVLPRYLGPDHPAIWILAVALALALGAAIGALHGTLVAYFGIPAFIVTLGAQLFWRGAAWWATSGATIGPLDSRFARIGGAPPSGSIGAVWSWAVGAVACLAIVASVYIGHRRRARGKFPRRPIWAEVALAALGCVIALGATAVVNAYPLSVTLAPRDAEANPAPTPAGEPFVSAGYAVPILIALAVGLIMIFLAKRTRFGRHVYAIGGNPEAAELAGVDTKRVTVAVFGLMGLLAGVSACIDSARLDSATSQIGALDELYVIAAAVIGGASLSGGVGTIVGALIGALLIQSLQFGAALLGFDSAVQQMVVGMVLVAAVGVDSHARRRAAKG
jgi:D-xylose transport system permease protein